MATLLTNNTIEEADGEYLSPAEKTRREREAFKALYGVDRVEVGLLNTMPFYYGGALDEYMFRDNVTGEYYSPYANVSVTNTAPGVFTYFNDSGAELGGVKDPGTPQDPGGDFFDDIGNLFEDAIDDVGNVGEEAIDDVGNVGEVALDDTGNLLEDARDEVGNGLEYLWDFYLNPTGTIDTLQKMKYLPALISPIGSLMRGEGWGDDEGFDEEGKSPTSRRPRRQRKIRGEREGVIRGALGSDSVLAGQDALGSGPGKRDLGDSLKSSSTILGL